MENSLQVLTTKNFNGIALDCYKSNGDNNDFWATREQIGQLLGYKRPLEAIGHIHKENSERLDKFSTLLKTSKVEGTRTVTRKAIVYNFKGLLEICRYSNQPKANDVIDFLWDVAEDIRKHGMYMSDKLQDAAQVDPEAFATVVNKYLAEKEKARKLEDYIEKNRAYTLLGEIVTSLEGSVPIAEATTMCVQHGYDIGRNRLYKLLRELKLVCSQKSRRNKPTQKGVEQGIVNLELDSNGNYTFTTRTMVTPKGMKSILSLLQSEQRPLEALWESEE